MAQIEDAAAGDVSQDGVADERLCEPR